MGEVWFLGLGQLTLPFPFHRPSPPLTLEDKCSPYWIAERRVPELITVLGSQPAGE